MVKEKEEEEEKKFKVPHGVKNEVFPTVADELSTVDQL